MSLLSLSFGDVSSLSFLRRHERSNRERDHRRGVARALVDATEFVAGRVWGYDSLFLHVHPTNTAARELYERAGYELVRDQRSDSSELLYYSKQIDARRLDDDDGDTI